MNLGISESAKTEYGLFQNKGGKLSRNYNIFRFQPFSENICRLFGN